jgi:hypothetical protein
VLKNEQARYGLPAKKTVSGPRICYQPRKVYRFIGDVTKKAVCCVR